MDRLSRFIQLERGARNNIEAEEERIVDAVRSEFHGTSSNHHEASIAFRLLFHQESWDRYILENEHSSYLRHMLLALCSIKYREIELQEEHDMQAVHPAWIGLRLSEIQILEVVKRKESCELETFARRNIVAAFQWDRSRSQLVFSISGLSIREASARKLVLEMEKKARHEEINYILAVLHSLQRRSCTALTKSESIERQSVSDSEFSERVDLYSTIHMVYHNFMALMEVIEFSKIRIIQRFALIEMKERADISQDFGFECGVLYEQFHDVRINLAKRDALVVGETNDRTFLVSRENYSRGMLWETFIEELESLHRMKFEQFEVFERLSWVKRLVFGSSVIILSRDEQIARNRMYLEQDWEFKIIRMFKVEERGRNSNKITFMSTLSLLRDNFRAAYFHLSERDDRTKIMKSEDTMRHFIEIKQITKEEVLRRSILVTAQENKHSSIFDMALSHIEQHNFAIQKRVAIVKFDSLEALEEESRSEISKEQMEGRREITTEYKRVPVEYPIMKSAKRVSMVLGDSNAKAVQGIMVLETTQRDKLWFCQKEDFNFFSRCVKLELLMVKIRSLTQLEEANDFLKIEATLKADNMGEQVRREKRSFFTSTIAELSRMKRELHCQDARNDLILMERAARETLQRTGGSTLLDLCKLELVKREQVYRDAAEGSFNRGLLSVREVFDRYREHIMCEIEDVRRTTAKELLENRRHNVYNELLMDNMEYFREIRCSFEADVGSKTTALLTREESEWSSLVELELVNLEYVQRKMKEASQLYFRKQIMLLNTPIFHKIATYVIVSRSYQQFYGLMRISFKEYTDRCGVMHSEIYYHTSMKFVHNEFLARNNIQQDNTNSWRALKSKEMTERFAQASCDLESAERKGRMVMIAEFGRVSAIWILQAYLWKEKTTTSIKLWCKWRKGLLPLTSEHYGTLYSSAAVLMSDSENELRSKIRDSFQFHRRKIRQGETLRILSDEEVHLRNTVVSAQERDRNGLMDTIYEIISATATKEQRIRHKIKIGLVEQRHVLSEEEGLRLLLGNAEVDGFSKIILEKKVNEVKMQLKSKNAMERPMSAPVESQHVRRMKRLTHSAFSSTMRSDTDPTHVAPLNDPPEFLAYSFSAQVGSRSRVRSRIGLRAPTNEPRVQITILPERDLNSLSCRDTYIYYCYKYGVQAVDAVMEGLSPVKGKFDYTSIVVGGRGDGFEWTHESMDCLDDGLSQSESVGHSFSADLISPIFTRSEKRGVSPDSSVLSYKSQVYPARANADQTLPAITAVPGVLHNTLHLPHESCAGKSILPFLEVARICRRLRVLALQGCAISNSNLEWICEAFQNHKYLQVLDVSFNSITALGGLVLEYFATHSSSIKVIDTTGTLLSAEQQRNIASLIDAKTDQHHK